MRRRPSDGLVDRLGLFGLGLGLWFGDGCLGRRLSGISREESAAASAYHSPLNYPPLIPKDRRLIITGLGDRLAPPDQAEKLWHHWDHCDLHWFPGNHVLHVSQPEYLRRMTRFLQGFMFD